MIKHPTITYFYQFLAEANIIFYVTLLFTYRYYSLDHYFSYILITLIIGGCYMLFEHFRLHRLYLIAIFLLSIGLFYIFEFLHILAFLYSFLFVWRYISIRAYKQLDHSGLYLHGLYNRYERNFDKIYLHLSIILAAFVFVVTKEKIVLLLFLWQFFLLLCGFWLSHFLSIQKEERKKLNFRYVSLLPVLLSFISVFAFFTYHYWEVVFQMIWNLIVYTFVFISNGVVNFISLFFPTIADFEVTYDSGENDVTEMINAFRERSFEQTQSNNDFIFISVVIIFVAGAILAYFLLRSFQKGQYIRFMKPDKNVDYEEQKKSKDRETSKVSGKSKQLMREKLHPVRKMIFNFEREAAKHELGRRAYESLSDWLHRLNVDIHITTYEKVRYGKKDVSEKEVMKLEEELKKVKQKLDLK